MIYVKTVLSRQPRSQTSPIVSSRTRDFLKHEDPCLRKGTRNQLTEAQILNSFVPPLVQCQCLPISMIQATLEFVRKGTDTWLLGCKKADLTNILTEIWGGTNKQYSLQSLNHELQTFHTLFILFLYMKQESPDSLKRLVYFRLYLQTYHFKSLNLLLFYKWHHQKVYRGPLPPRPPCAFQGALPFRVSASTPPGLHMHVSNARH